MTDAFMSDNEMKGSKRFHAYLFQVTQEQQ